MDQSFYIGAIGAHQQLRHLNVIGNNFANINSYGYKASKARFTALMYQDMAGIEDDMPHGVGTRIMMTTTDFAQGGAAETGRSLDYMIEGEGFFGLVDMATGEISFTRKGAFVMSEYQRRNGDVDEEGNPVLETVYCLSDNQGRFVLSREGGLIEVTDPKAELPVGVFDYRNYDGITMLDETRYLPVDKNGDLWMGEGTPVQGYLEMSNVDLADEFTKVIEAQRAYGLALKVVQTSDEIETTINGLRT